VAFGPVTVATGTLTVIDPPEQRGRSFDLTEELTVGRAPGCQVLLEGDTFVSQLHARVFTRDGALFVEDLGSTNGTLVNRRKIKAAVPLHQGDTLQVGRTILEVG
jgi:pSer/pThr/pTyr-binding forkhead associated (FHA) protein